MAQLEFFLVAESCAIDALTNRVSIFNVLEDVKSRQFPAHIPNLAAVAAWNADPGDQELDFQATLLVHAPGAAAPTRFDVNFRVPQARARTVLQLENFPVPAAGTVRFEILLNGEHKANHLLAVSLVAEPPVLTPTSMS